MFKYFEVVPLDTDTDVSSTTECASGDGCSEVKQENLTSVKHEPDDVCWFCYSTHTFNLSQQKQFLHIVVNICFFINYQFSIAALISSSSPSSSWSRSRRGPSRRCTSMSTVDSTPPQLFSRNRFVAGRASCSVDATCGQEVGRLSDTLMWS